MRIAFHNPWLSSSENQAYMSMAQAGRRIGVELIACASETDIEACQPDFVLAVASSIAKITDFPTYLTVHEPKEFYLSQLPLLRNLFSFDGYLTISDSLVRFIKDICTGVGRVEEPGFCYLTPQISDLHCDWDRPDRAETLKVAYFGTNWSRRMPLLFRALDPMGILRIHGPEESWAAENLASYQGPADFDGVGPQHSYADCGIGLALLDDRWQREDVISNRIFEISSVGAVSICPDMPWTRKWFGDSVLYFDASRPLREIAEKVRQHHDFCRANPAAAGAMGREARRIFETHFCAERLLANAVVYHRRKMQEQARRVAAMAPAQISVIVRCGGRGLDVVSRAVESIRRQTFGRVTVILAKYRDLDLSPITGVIGGAIVAFDEFLIEDGGRAVMLWAGLNRVATAYFAILDDDDFWLSDHLETLFHAGRRVDAAFDIAFSGVVHFDAPVPYNNGRQFSTRNIERFGFPARISDAWQIAAAVSTCNFVARRDLLTEEMLICPAELRSAEDSVLIGFVARRSKPIFSWRPTAFYRPHAADGSNWQQDAQRADDEMSFALRTGLMWAPRWLNDPSFEMTNLVWGAARHRPGSAVMGEQMDRLVAGQAGEKTPRGIRARPGIQGFVGEGPQARLKPGRYIAVFLITPSAPADGMPPSTGDEPAGAVEIVVLAPGGAYLGHRTFDGDDAELLLRFTVDAAAAGAPIDLRDFAYGNTAFTLASVGLHRDFDDVATGDGPTGEGARATEPVWRGKPHAAPTSAEVEALRAEIGAMRRSTSWRLTAPMRRLVTLARGRRK